MFTLGTFGPLFLCALEHIGPNFDDGLNLVTCEQTFTLTVQQLLVINECVVTSFVSDLVGVNDP